MEKENFELEYEEIEELFDEEYEEEPIEILKGVGVKDTEKGKEFNADGNNPFWFAVGVSKQFKAAKKPTLYAQFVFNTDPFASFGSGQDTFVVTEQISEDSGLTVSIRDSLRMTQLTGTMDGLHFV